MKIWIIFVVAFLSICSWFIMFQQSKSRGSTHNVISSTSSKERYRTEQNWTELNWTGGGRECGSLDSWKNLSAQNIVSVFPFECECVCAPLLCVYVYACGWVYLEKGKVNAEKFVEKSEQHCDGVSLMDELSTDGWCFLSYITSTI